MNRYLCSRERGFASKIERPWNATAAECLWLRGLRNEDNSTFVQRFPGAAEGCNVYGYCRSITNSTYSSFCGGDARKHCETYTWTSEAIVFQKVTRFARSFLYTGVHSHKLVSDNFEELASHVVMKKRPHVICFDSCADFKVNCEVVIAHTHFGAVMSDLVLPMPVVVWELQYRSEDFIVVDRAHISTQMNSFLLPTCFKYAWLINLDYGVLNYTFITSFRKVGSSSQ